MIKGKNIHAKFLFYLFFFLRSNFEICIPMHETRKTFIQINIPATKPLKTSEHVQLARRKLFAGTSGQSFVCSQLKSTKIFSNLITVSSLWYNCIAPRQTQSAFFEIWRSRGREMIGCENKIRINGEKCNSCAKARSELRGKMEKRRERKSLARGTLHQIHDQQIDETNYTVLSPRVGLISDYDRYLCQ